MKVGLLGLMFLVMFGLKLAGPMAGVSWLWITAPLWVPALLIGGSFCYLGYRIYKAAK